MPGKQSQATRQPDSGSGMRVAVFDSIAAINRDDWNRVAGDEYPFLRYDFLHAAESSGSVSAASGWRPCHLAIHDRDGRIRGAMPLYEKSHSWGEFVFDWAWANAYARAGLAYYPKLVSAVPFTPAPSPRLLCADDDDAAAALLLDAACDLARERSCSSLHILFPLERELRHCRESGLKVRKDCQFHWHNRGYRTFDEFLDTFSSRKRKKVRRERRRVREAGIRFHRLAGGDLDATAWRAVYALISRTFLARGSLPYYNLAFFESLGERSPGDLLVILAEHDGDPVAAAIFFVSDGALYGRYWGSAGDYDSLHFETCYYQGIEYCIDLGIGRFEPGTQGEHKVSRGFLPQPTWSAHWLARPEFLDAIGRYVDEEARHIDRYMDAVDEHSPYRRDGSES